VTNNFHFRLPDWPPQRLVREAVLAWNLRHLSQDKLDVETSPWPLVRGAILAFLRHLHSDYDERLRVRCERDPKFRDDLAAQVAAAAYQSYLWLGKDDPRPFPESEQDSMTLPFDVISKSLSNSCTIRDQTISAIRDLKRQGNHKHEIAALENGLQKNNRDIERQYSFLSSPKILPEQGKTRYFLQVHKQDDVDPHYHFCSNKEVTPNRIEYIGFRCPRCGVSVARWKQIVPLGQGYRCVTFACHCLTVAVHTPGGIGRIEPMSAENWARYCQESDE
jgi:predicted RNA-binding Zn-ribbon protein involved in translation (DUF1610 family)